MVINVSIWSIHITWSVHPWRTKVYRKEVLKLFAEQLVSTVYPQTKISQKNLGFDKHELYGDRNESIGRLGSKIYGPEK